VLITSLPKETVGASLLVKAYFDRRPYEELQFRDMKAFACLNRVAGYGKKRVPDEKVRQTQKDLQVRITALRQKLSVPLKAMADQEERLAICIDKERRIHSQIPIVSGKRIIDDKTRPSLKSLSGEMAQCRRQIKSIESKWGKDLERLRKYEKAWLRLHGKEYVYRIDVELDQIMSYFRIGLVNLSSRFLHECLPKHTMALSKLLHNTLLMPAAIELTKGIRRIMLKRNPKDPEGMQILEPALQKLNDLRIEHLDGRRIEFSLV
jgi:hypothetical protein